MPRRRRRAHGRAAGRARAARSRRVTRGGVPLGAVVHDEALGRAPRRCSSPCSRPRGCRSRSPACASSCAASSPRSRPRARGSWPRATRSGGASSATCTTARSSAWSPSACRCATSSTSSAVGQRRRHRARRRGGRGRPRDRATCASSRAACARRAWTTVWPPALRELGDRTPCGSRSRRPPERFAAEVEATAYFVASRGDGQRGQARRCGSVTRAARRDGGTCLRSRDDGCGGADAAPARA